MFSQVFDFILLNDGLVVGKYVRELIDGKLVKKFPEYEQENR